MKNSLIILLIGFCSLNVFTQKNNNLKAYMDYKNFYNPEIGNFVEIHLQFVSYTLNYLPVQNGLQSEVAVQYVFKKDNQIVKTDAYRLQSPLMRDSIIEDFFEIKRIDLKPGKYTLELNLSDINSTNSGITAVQEIEVEDLSSKITLSSLETAEMMIPQKGGTNTLSVFSKSGYEIIPRISNYYSTTATKIPVYFEIYHPKTTDSINTIGLKQTLIDSKTKSEIESFTRFTKHQVNEVQPVIRLIDISKLKSGEYILEYSLIDKENNNIHSSSYYFERFSEMEYEPISTAGVVLDLSFQASITDDSLIYYIKSLFPIMKPAESKNVINLLATKDKELYRKYIQSFWSNSTGNVKTYEKWLDYKGQVQLTQRSFGNNFLEGYETDRGRIYLKYGPPSNIISKEVSSAEVPFEVWRYDKIAEMSNRKFIFYNPDLVNSNYRLLHSDVRGEIQNLKWPKYLKKQDGSNFDVYDDNEGKDDYFGSDSQELFNQY